MSNKIQIPIDTMEQEFTNYYRLGYKKGLAENADRITELEAWKTAVLDALAVTCSDAPIGTAPRDIINQVVDFYATLVKYETEAQLADAKKDAIDAATAEEKADQYNLSGAEFHEQEVENTLKRMPVDTAVVTWTQSAKHSVRRETVILNGVAQETKVKKF